MPSQVIDSIFFRDLYGSVTMRAVFDDMTLLQKWLDFEAALAPAEAQVGIVPADPAQEITRKAVAGDFDTHAIKLGIGTKVHPPLCLNCHCANLCERGMGRNVRWC